MPTAKIEEIRSLPLFAGTRDESFRALVRGAYMQHFPPHMELAVEGESPDFLHIIVSGTVELFSNWQGRETRMQFLGPNDTFILAATLKDRPYLMSARTLEKSLVILIPSEDIREVFQNDAEFAKSIVLELACCYRQAIKSAKNIKLRSSPERVANYLLKLYQKNGNTPDFTLPFEKRRIAEFLGMTPENLSRSFASLKSRGVSVSNRKIHIDDIEKLTDFAHPTPLIDS